MRKKIISGILALSVLVLGIMPAVSLAEETDNTDLIAQLQAQIQSLLAQMSQLQEQISQLQGEQSTLREEIKDLRLEARQLREGLSGEDVKLLQELLATDPAIYPQGLITGFFGPLTKNAVKKFQKKFGIEQVGEVGPLTRSKINKILQEGAGKSGKIPPGWLISPGIAKKYGVIEAPADQVLPPGIAKKVWGFATPDIIAPVISDIAVTSSAMAATVTWTTDENADSTVWYDTSTPVTAADPTGKVTNGALVTSHSEDLAGLIVSTTYYYVVVSADEAGNSTTSSEGTFDTLAE